MNIQSTRPILQKRVATNAAPKQEHKTGTECPENPPGVLTQAVNILATGAKHTLNEGVLAAKNDPALAMRMAATTLSDQILKKVDVPVKAGFDRTIVPVMRFALLGGNAIRARKTFQDPLSTKLDRTIDGIVVASDIVGAVGGIAMLASTRFAGLGESLMGFSYAVDAVSHAYRGLDHAAKRIAFWSETNTDEKPKMQS